MAQSKAAETTQKHFSENIAEIREKNKGSLLGKKNLAIQSV